MSDRAFVALLEIELHFPDAESLKAKRRELSSVKAALHQRHGLSVAEVGHQDLWQRATLAAALTGGSPSRLDDAVGRIEEWLDARFPQGVRVDTAVASFDDLLGLR